MISETFRRNMQKIVEHVILTTYPNDVGRILCKVLEHMTRVDQILERYQLSSNSNNDSWKLFYQPTGKTEFVELDFELIL